MHSVASQLPGAGAQLLRGLTQEANDKGWSLVLDASNERLVQYYEQFGFVVRGAGVRMPDGALSREDVAPPCHTRKGAFMQPNRLRGYLDALGVLVCEVIGLVLLWRAGTFLGTVDFPHFGTWL